MARKFLDYSGLGTYDENIKAYIDEEIASIPSDVFVVTITGNKTDGFNMDKSYDEIKQAYDGGKVLYVKYSDSYDTLFTLVSYDERNSYMTGFTFKNVASNNKSSTTKTFAVFSTGNINYTENEFSQDRISTVNNNSTLTTTDKTLVGAINELDAEMDSHNHDDIYYTEEEIDTLLAEKQDKDFIVTITGNSADGYAADKTPAEIYEAFNSGKYVYAICSGGIYNLSGCNSSYAMFIAVSIAGNFLASYTITNSKVVFTTSSYYTEEEIDQKLSAVNTNITNITSGSTPVKEAEHATSADTATNATNANHASSADTATTATSATKATQDGNGKVIANTYETKADAQTKLNEAKSYADTAASTVKNDLLNGAGAAYDTLKELGELIDENSDAIDALETVASGKADKEHTHEISDVANLQDALDEISANANESDVFYINVTGDANQALTANKTYAEVENAYKDGKLPCVIYDNYAFQLVDTYTNNFAFAALINETYKLIMINSQSVYMTQTKLVLENGHTDFTTTSKSITGAIKELASGKADSDHSHDDKYYTEAEIDEMMAAMTIEEIDAICAMDDITALVKAEYLAEATDSEGNILTDNQDNTYVF